MKTIKSDELYQHLSEFLKGKGVEFKEGPYTHRIRQGCGLLTDAINCAQHGLKEAKAQMDKGVDQMRQVIHEKTAPIGSSTPTGGAKSASTGRRSKAKSPRNPRKPDKRGR